MALSDRGEFIGHCVMSIAGKPHLKMPPRYRGRLRVFSDLKHAGLVWILDNSDEWIRVNRDSVTFVKAR